MLTNEQLTTLVTELTDRVRILEEANDRRLDEVNSRIDSVDGVIDDIRESIDDIQRVCEGMDTAIDKTESQLDELSDEVCYATADVARLTDIYENNYPLAESFEELEKIFRSYYNKCEVKK